MNTYDDDLHKDVENILQEQQLMLLNQLNAKDAQVLIGFRSGRKRQM
ncbi:MAG: hypothetical protein IPK08_17930 [Bacteroidetes bacterium]|nr:hypothetical protein [Bacteroidota bacterium]